MAYKKINRINSSTITICVTQPCYTESNSKTYIKSKPILRLTTRKGNQFG